MNEGIQVWFPEPVGDDLTAASRDEHTLEWLARCNNWKAKECRRFLNESLSSVPSAASESFMKSARSRWKSAYFELVVCRTLQELGATIEIEQANDEGKQPDFRASFDDCSVIVEAVSPVINADAGEKVKQRNPLLEIVEKKLPDGWRCGVWELPEIGLADSKKEFNAALDTMFSDLPERRDGERVDICKEVSNGLIRILLFPGESKSGRVMFEPPITVFDNSEDRIRYSLKRKKRQVRSSDEAVLLAVDASGISSELEDFDKVLFGHTFEKVDQDGRTIEIGFDADGYFQRNRTERSSYAGLLAFLEVGFQKCPNPVLYLHPRFEGSLPQAMNVLERRTYDCEANKIDINENTDDVMNRLNFVKRPTDVDRA